MFVKNSTYEALKEELKEVRRDLNLKDAELKKAQQKIKESLEVIEAMAKDKEVYTSNIVSKKEKDTSVTMTFSPDYQSVTPVTSINPETLPKLVEAGFLPANKREDLFAAHIAVILAASDAIEQIIVAFEETVQDTDFQEED